MENKNPSIENFGIDDLVDKVKLFSKEVVEFVEELSKQEFQEKELKKHIDYLRKNSEHLKSKVNRF